MHDRLHLQRLAQVLRHHPVVAALATAAAGVETHLVGGVLRDRFLGLPSHDFDAVVAGDGRAIAGRVADALGGTLVLLGGKAFAAYRVVGAAAGDVFVLDLWDRRATPLADDLARRDFTVNSFAVGIGDPERTAGDPIDPFGGLAAQAAPAASDHPGELSRRPATRSPPPPPYSRLRRRAGHPRLARTAAAGLVEVAAERVREELVLIFKGDDAHRGLALLAALDVYPGLWLGSPGRPGATGGAIRELESLAAAAAWLHQLAAAGPTGAGGAAAGEVDLLAARLALTFAHLPPAASPPRVGAAAPARPRGTEAAVESFRAAGYLTRGVADRVRRLHAVTAIPADERARRLLLHHLGDLWPTAAATLGAAALSRGPGEAERWRRDAAGLAALVAADGERILAPPRLLSGEEVQVLLGVPAGEKVGQALAAVQRAQVEGQIRTREEAIALLSNAAVVR